MPSAFWIRIVIGLAATAYLVLAYVFGVSVEKHWLQLLGGVTFAVIAVLTAFDLYLWRLLPFAISRRPRLSGTWKTHIDSNWVDPGSGQPVSKDFYLVIRQTFSSIKVTCLFDISRSRSTTADLVNEQGDLVLSYIYWSAADTDKRTGNPPHRGTTSLVVSRQPQLAMEGDYWTERDSRGTIRTLGRTRKHYSSFRAAHTGRYV